MERTTLGEDARRKLVTIRPAGDDTPRVFVRFVTNGGVDENGPTPDTTGYTTWTFKPNGDPRFVRVQSLDDALDACLSSDP